MKSVLIPILAGLLLVGGPVAADNGIRQEVVHFQPGQNGTAIKGKIRGEQSIDYLLSAVAGQRIDVALKADNRSAYFNVLAPGAVTALFVGSGGGNRYAGELPRSGDYILRVYLMRNAARRNESANYTLNVTLLGQGMPDKAPSAVDLAPAVHDASGMVRCSTSLPALDQQCPFRVVRDRAQGTARIWIENIAYPKQARYRFFRYADQQFSTNDRATISAQRQADHWILDVDGKEFYLIPEALIFGG